MKRIGWMGFGTGICVAVAGVLAAPGFANLQQANSTIAQVQKSAPVQLRLAAERQTIEQTPQGERTVWRPLEGAISPGTLVRYLVSGRNTSDRPVNNLVIVQPVPKQTVYLLNSARTNRGVATLTYSIDNARSFSGKPTIRVKAADGTLTTQPAPAAAYTHIRWQFTTPIAPSSSVEGSYQVKVR